VLEKYGDKLFTLKRPGTASYITLGAGGTSQGITYYNGLFYGVVNDIMYRQTGTVNVGADGTAWTTLSGSPDWPATELQNAVVFNNRIFMIGGVTASAGIWSTADGVNWTVNYGGQPWGLRDQQGVVVFNNQMFVAGGYNITLASCFNDVWSTPDGTNWVSISDPGVAGWTARCAHCCVAANNGIYIFGGFDPTTGPTYFNDVWFSSDGINWVELTSAAPWTAREGASAFYFENNLWIVGGYDGSNYLEDSWYSPDGINWAAGGIGIFSGAGRSHTYSTVYRGQMWMIGGQIAAGPGVSSDVWSSSDGISWTLVSTGAITARGNGQAVVFGIPTQYSQYNYDTIYLLGGDSGTMTLKEVLVGDLNVNLPTAFPLTPDVSQDDYQFNTFLSGRLLIVKNSSNMWVLQSGQLVEITDSNYPSETVPGIVHLNAFIYVMTPQGVIQGCALENVFQWPALNFLTADFDDDRAVALAKHLNYVVALKEYSTQFFFDNGANQPEGSPLAPYINANMKIGCVSAKSVEVVDNSLFWVAQTKGAGRTVVRLDGLQVTTVSTPYIDKILMQTSAANMHGINMSIGGHQYYIVKTGTYTALCYDTTFNEWYEWDTFGYRDFVTNGNVAGWFLWSTTGGNLVQTDPTLYTDVLNGTFSFYVQTDKVDFGNTALKFYGRAVLVGDRSNATPSITYSDDDYTTYTNAGTVDMQSNRPFLSRLGSARRRSWKPVQTDAYPARWEALEIEFSQGES
jgi:hypothetical protein